MTDTQLDTTAAAAAARPFTPARLAITTAAAVIANSIVFFIASALGASMLITQPAESRLGIGMVIAATLVPLALAGVAVWFLARRWPIMRTIAAWSGLVLAVLSSASPLLVSADLTTGLALGLMHLVAGIAWFVGIRKPVT